MRLLDFLAIALLFQLACGRTVVVVDNDDDDDEDDNAEEYDSNLYFNGGESKNENNPLAITEKDIPKNGELFEGDMVMDDSLRRAVLGEENKKAAVFSSEVGSRRHWPGGVVPYEVDDSLIDAIKVKIPIAIKVFEKFTCVHWVPRNVEKHEDYVTIMNGKGCSSSVGRQGGEQTIHLSKGCKRIGTILHEMMHVLGIIHEQSRPDRDQYLDIDFKNIKSGLLNNFQKYSYYRADTLDVPYNYYSIMHYSNHAFSRNKRDTLTSKYDRHLKFGQRKMMSNLDAEQINRLYPCEKDIFKMSHCIDQGCEGRKRCCLIRDMTAARVLRRKRRRDFVVSSMRYLFNRNT